MIEPGCMVRARSAGTGRAATDVRQTSGTAAGGRRRELEEQAGGWWTGRWKGVIARRKGLMARRRGLTAGVADDAGLDGDATADEAAAP